MCGWGRVWCWSTWCGGVSLCGVGLGVWGGVLVGLGLLLSHVHVLMR